MRRPRRLVIRNVEIDGARGLDVAVQDGAIAEIGPNLRGGDTTLQGDGGALIPGLIDHHVHILGLAAERASVRLGPEDVAGPEPFVRALMARDAELAPGEWLRGVGYHDSVSGPLDRTLLDRLGPSRPVRIQHRSGALWVFNSAGLDLLLRDAEAPDSVERGADGRPTGRVYRGDAWVAGRLAQIPPPLAPVGREFASRGVTGLTDAGVTNNADRAGLLEGARLSGDLPQKLLLMSGGELPASQTGAYAVGPVKILLDDAELGDLAPVIAAMRDARRWGRGVAVHCVTAAELAFTLAAFDVVGAHAGDRIEHGGVVHPDMADDLAARRLTVVTQPSFVAERGDQYAAELPAGDLAALYPCASLMAAGIKVAGSTDAPYTRPDPWAAMDAAMQRRTRSGLMLGPGERLDGARALALFLGDFADPGGAPRRVQVGAPADLCLLSAPLSRVLAQPREDWVRVTLIDGQAVFAR